jgi:hypothetical protein
MAEWLSLLFRILEIPALNLGSDTVYPDGLSWFFHCSCREMSQYYLKLSHDLFPYYFQLFISHVIHSELLIASFNKYKVFNS